MICQNNQWLVKQRCTQNQNCITERGCVEKSNAAPFPDYSNFVPTIPAPKESPIDLGCNSIGDTTCMGKLFLVCKQTQLGKIWTNAKDCGKPEFCSKKDGCILTQPKKVDLDIKNNQGKTVISRSELRIDLVKQQKDIKLKLEELKNKISRFKGKDVMLSEKKVSKEEFKNYLKDLEEELNSIGDDAQLAQIDLQNTLQKQQQLLQTLSNVAESMFDSTMSVIRKSSGLTSEESEQTTKKNYSRGELDDIIKDVEAQQETLRDRRQMASTTFQNVDQKANQLYNMLSSVLKTMNEARGLGAGSRSSALTSEEKERSEELSESEKEAEDLREKLIQLVKEAQKDSNEDKEYYLKKLEMYNTMGEQLADYLRDLVEQSTELSNVSAGPKIKPDKKPVLKLRDLKKENVIIIKEDEQDKTNKLIAELLKQVKQGNVEAVDQLLILISKKSKKEQEAIAKNLISALNELDQKQQKLSEQLSNLKTDKSQSQRLADLNKDLNKISASRKAITDTLRETMQVQEEVADTTKSILDKQGRITRKASRFEDPKIKIPPDKKLGVLNKAWNWFKNIFVEEQEDYTIAESSTQEESSTEQVPREYPWCDDPDGNDVTIATTVNWQDHNWSWQESKQDTCTGYNLRKVQEATCGTYHEEWLDCPEGSICVSGACTPESQVEDREAAEREAWRQTGDERSQTEYWLDYCLDYRLMDTDAPGVVTYRTCGENYNCSDLITVEESCTGNMALHYRCTLEGALGRLITSEEDCGENAQCVIEPWGASCRPRDSGEDESCTRTTDLHGLTVVTYRPCADCEPVEYRNHCLEGNRVAKVSCLRNRPVEITEDCHSGLTCPLDLTENAIRELGFTPQNCGNYVRYENDRGPECTQTTAEDGSIIVRHKRCTNCQVNEYHDECSNDDFLTTFRCEGNEIDYGAVDCGQQGMTCPRGARACQ